MRKLTTSEASQLRSALKRIVGGPEKNGLTRTEEDDMKAVEEDAAKYQG